MPASAQAQTICRTLYQLLAIKGSPASVSPGELERLSNIPARTIAQLMTRNRADIDDACAEHGVRIAAYHRGGARGGASIDFERVE